MMSNQTTKGAALALAIRSKLKAEFAQRCAIAKASIRFEGGFGPGVHAYHLPEYESNREDGKLVYLGAAIKVNRLASEEEARVAIASELDFIEWARLGKGE